MAIPQYRPTNSGFYNAARRWVSSSSSSYSNLSSDAIEELFERAPRSNVQQSHRVQRNLLPTSSQSSTDARRSRRSQVHCNKCHQMRMNRWHQRYSMPSPSHQPISESKLDFFVLNTVANDRRCGSSTKRHCWRVNHW